MEIMVHEAHLIETLAIQGVLEWFCINEDPFHLASINNR